MDEPPSPAELHHTDLLELWDRAERACNETRSLLDDRREIIVKLKLWLDDLRQGD